MKLTVTTKRLALAILLIAAMVATAGCGPAGIAFALDQMNNLDEQEVETPEADESDDDDQGEDENEVEGVIDSISGNTIVVDGQTFTVPDNLLDELALLSPGMKIEVEFFVDASGNVVITEFAFDDEAEDLDDEEDQGEDEDDQGEEDDDESDDDDDEGEHGDSGGEDDDD